MKNKDKKCVRVVDTDQHLLYLRVFYRCAVCCIPRGFVCLRANDMAWTGIGGPEDLHSEHIAKVLGYGRRMLALLCW